jgi:hypothetical protein
MASAFTPCTAPAAPPFPAPGLPRLSPPLPAALPSPGSYAAWSLDLALYLAKAA